MCKQEKNGLGMNRICANVDWQCSLTDWIFSGTVSRTSLKMQISAAYAQALNAFFLLSPKMQINNN